MGMKKRREIALACLVGFGVASSANADGWTDQLGNAVGESAKPTASAAAPAEALDPRLPPMLPGEEVTRGGKKMRVWTTTGPVPVTNLSPPQAPGPPGQANIAPGNVSIVVDRREAEPQVQVDGK